MEEKKLIIFFSITLLIISTTLILEHQEKKITKKKLNETTIKYEKETQQLKNTINKLQQEKTDYKNKYEHTQTLLQQKQEPLLKQIEKEQTEKERYKTYWQNKLKEYEELKKTVNDDTITKQELEQREFKYKEDFGPLQIHENRNVGLILEEYPQETYKIRFIYPKTNGE